MHCPFCGNMETQVKDSRLYDDNSIKRRRYCAKCDSRFTTFERIQLKEIIVLKRNGDKKIFDSEKLKKSIGMSVRKRPVTDEQVDKMVNNISKRLEESGDSVILSSQIGDLALESLKNLDEVAFVRFASVYKNFKTSDDFKEFVGKIIAN